MKTPLLPTTGWTLHDWQQAYRDGRLQPDCLHELLETPRGKTRPGSCWPNRPS